MMDCIHHHFINKKRSIHPHYHDQASKFDPKKSHSKWWFKHEISLYYIFRYVI